MGRVAQRKTAIPDDPRGARRGRAPQTASQKWSSSWRIIAPNSIFAPPILLGPRLCYAGLDDRVTCVRASNGHRLWTVDLGDRLSRGLTVLAGRAGPALEGEVLLVVPDDGASVIALDAYDGRRVAVFELPPTHHFASSALVVSRDRIAIPRKGYEDREAALVLLRLKRPPPPGPPPRCPIMAAPRAPDLPGGDSWPRKPRPRASAGSTESRLLEMYRAILLSRKIDDKEIQLKRQSKIYFQINGVGHEAVGAAMGQVFRPGHDWFFFYYRDRAAALCAGDHPARDASPGGRRQRRAAKRRAADALALLVPQASHREHVVADRALSSSKRAAAPKRGLLRGR